MYNLKLEQMYDDMAPGWDQYGLNDRPRYRIYAKEDTERLGLLTPAGQPFKCHLCGAADLWYPENENVFVCEHEPVCVGRGAIRQISSIPTKMIDHHEMV